MERLGVALCTGCGIGEALDPTAFDESIGELGGATTLTHASLCSPEGLAAIRESVEQNILDSVLICACSSRAKIEEFNSLDRSKLGIERVSLREMVVWTHPAGEEDTQMLADDLIRMGIVKLQKSALAERLQGEIATTVLVVGGGDAAAHG